MRRVILVCLIGLFGCATSTTSASGSEGTSSGGTEAAAETPEECMARCDADRDACMPAASTAGPGEEVDPEEWDAAQQQRMACGETHQRCTAACHQ